MDPWHPGNSRLAQSPPVSIEDFGENERVYSIDWYLILSKSITWFLSALKGGGAWENKGCGKSG